MSDLDNKEKELLLDHDYDGIQEFDYPLPVWWQITFWGGVIFGIFYIIYFIFMNGPSLKHEYKMSKAEAYKIRKTYYKNLTKFDQTLYNAYVVSPEMKNYGKNVFEANCMSCHNKNGAGNIGPNLTDKYWLLTEGKVENTYKTVITGNPIAGMPSWGPLLAKDDIYAVVAYIFSIQGYQHTDPPAKAPQGDLYE